MNTRDPHLRSGWWSLLGWLVLGIVLEGLHAFKASWYLDAGQETRRLMFTLAHAHGVLLALVNIAAGLTVRAVAGLAFSRSASLALLWSAQLLPLGFLLGGAMVHEGDPGPGILLVPPSALALVYGVWHVAQSAMKTGVTPVLSPPPAAPPPGKARDNVAGRNRR